MVKKLTQLAAAGGIMPRLGARLTEIVADSGGVIRAYRHGRIVQRRQQIGPYVVDLRCGLLQAVKHIGNMLLVKLGKPMLDRINGKNLAAYADRGRCTGHHVQKQFKHTRHVVVGAFLMETVIINLPLDPLSLIVSVNRRLPRTGGRGIDGWISIALLNIILLSIISV